MIEISKILPLTTEYPLELLGNTDRLLFFDIETTGFSPRNSSVYLIGCVYPSQGHIEFRQFLAESLSQEAEILEAFFSLCSSFDTLIHFNGDTFDIRYLETAAAQYHIASPLGAMKSIDILKQVRHHRKIFPIDNLRQKTIEKFLGMDREDLYSGGELIPVYEEYVKSRHSDLLSLLLLHNEEDVKDMVRLLNILSYTDTLNTPDRFLTISSVEPSDDFRSLTVYTDSSFIYPKRLTAAIGNNVRLTFEDRRLIVCFPVFAGTLKYFFPDPHNYYYLPSEDRAIHKKVARFTDPGHREQAVRENCYTRVTGIFAEAVSSDAGLFYTSWKCGPGMQRIDEDGALEKYLDDLLRKCR